MWTAVEHGSGGLSGRQKPLEREGAEAAVSAEALRLQSAKEKMDQQSSPNLRGNDAATRINDPGEGRA